RVPGVQSVRVKAVQTVPAGSRSRHDPRRGSGRPRAASARRAKPLTLVSAQRYFRLTSLFGVRRPDSHDTTRDVRSLPARLGPCSSAGLVNGVLPSGTPANDQPRVTARPLTGRAPAPRTDPGPLSVCT